jgi:hypothetical protein
MFCSRGLRFSGHQRPFWLLVALAVMLLISVSITVAQADSPTRLVEILQRDLGALRVQLEQIDPRHDAGGQETVTFNTDIADGSAAFRRSSMATLVHTTERHLERLLDVYREMQDQKRVQLAEMLQLSMYELRERIDRLAGPAEPATTIALRDQASSVLDELDQGLGRLASAAGEAAAAPAGGDVSASAVDPATPRR